MSTLSDYHVSFHAPYHTPCFLHDVSIAEPRYHTLQAATHVYNKKAAVVIYKKLAAARKVVLPQGVSQEDQTLFAGVDQPDPMDVLAGIHDPGNGGEPAPGADKPAAPPPAPALRPGGHSLLQSSPIRKLCNTDLPSVKADQSGLR